MWRRAWILIAGYSANLKPIAICALSVSVAATDERRALIATFIWSCLIIVAATGFLLLPPLSIVEGDVSSEYLIQLLPQAVPLAIPIGVAFGVAFGMAGWTATRSVKKVILLTAVFASLVSFMTLAWAMPAGNQAYRESVGKASGHSGTAGEELRRGPCLSSIARLSSPPRRATCISPTIYVGRSPSLRAGCREPCACRLSCRH